MPVYIKLNAPMQVVLLGSLLLVVFVVDNTLRALVPIFL